MLNSKWNQQKASAKFWKYIIASQLDENNYAVTMFNKIYTNPNRPAPPEHVQNFILQHENGHVTGRHSLLRSTINLSIFAAVALVVYTANIKIGMSASFLMYAIATTAIWLSAQDITQKILEKRADQFAINAIGYNASVNALAWLADNSNANERPYRIKRLENFVKKFAG